MRLHRLVAAGLAAVLTAGIAIGGVRLTGAASGAGTATSVVPVAPYRILDTRNGIGAAAAPITGGGTVDVTMAGVGPVPADAVGVVLNVTGTRATEATYVTAWPTGTAMPTASVLNLTPGIDAPNAVTALLGDGGRVSFFNFTGSTHLIADVAGYLIPAESAGGGTGPGGAGGPQGPPGPPGPTAATYAHNLASHTPGTNDRIVVDLFDDGSGGLLNIDFPARIVINGAVSVDAWTASSADPGVVEMECGAQIFPIGVGSAVDAGPRVVLQFLLTGQDFFSSEVAPINAVVDRPPGSYNVRIVCRRPFVNAMYSVVNQASLTVTAVAR